MDALSPLVLAIVAMLIAGLVIGTAIIVERLLRRRRR